MSGSAGSPDPLDSSVADLEPWERQQWRAATYGIAQTTLKQGWDYDTDFSEQDPDPLEMRFVGGPQKRDDSPAWSLGQDLPSPGELISRSPDQGTTDWIKDQDDARNQLNRLRKFPELLARTIEDLEAGSGVDAAGEQSDEPQNVRIRIARQLADNPGEWGSEGRYRYDTGMEFEEMLDRISGATDIGDHRVRGAAFGLAPEPVRDQIDVEAGVSPDELEEMMEAEQTAKQVHYEAVSKDTEGRGEGNGNDGVGSN